MGTCKITYKTKLICENEADRLAILEILRNEQTVFNFCSKVAFESKSYGIKYLHHEVYRPMRELGIKSQFVICGERACIAAYRSIAGNRHSVKEAAIKKRLSIQLDKRLYRRKGDTIFVTTQGKRVATTFVHYDKLNAMLENNQMCDPRIVCQNDELYYCFTFVVEVNDGPATLALGVDMGYRRYAATSDGKLLIDKQYNKQKRKARYLKRCLQAKKTKSANRHLKKLRNRERNQSRDFNHKLANEILRTTANVIVVEELDVKQLKKRRHKGKTRSRKNQVSLGELRRMLTYKAALAHKQVVSVNPKYTSQRDCLTGKLVGERKGCRFYAHSGLVYDADINAAVNIAKRTKLPVLQGNLLDGQGLVIGPIVGQQCTHRLPNLFGSI